MAITPRAGVQTAEKYVSRGKIEPAIREYRKLLADNPKRHQHAEPDRRPLRSNPAH